VSISKKIAYRRKLIAQQKIMAMSINETNDSNKHREELEINIFGIKFKCVAPTSRTITILILFFLFIVLLALILPRFTVLKWITG
jgi:hypothetical protein